MTKREMIELLRYKAYPNKSLEEIQDMLNEVADYIEKAEVVIRCKDCEYCMRDYHNLTGLKCDFSFTQICVDGDWFCANGRHVEGQ